MASGLSRPALGQEPTATSAPKLAVPAQRVLTEAPAQPAPAAQVPSQPTAAAPPPADSAPVTALPPPSGVTQLPPPSGTTASSSQAATADKRSYVVGRFGLALDGVQVGSVKSVAGGSATAVVVAENVGPDHVAKKHLGGVRYEDISVATGLDSKVLNDWIAATMKGNYQRKNGSVLEADFDYKVRGEREFYNALLSGITFPTLDASSKDAGFITVQIAPEYTRMKAGSGATMNAAINNKQQPKKWLLSSFKFEMDGLDGSRVSRIESFTIGQQAVENPIGEMRDYEKAPAHLEFPNLKITLASSGVQTWAAWHDDFVIKGNATDDKEKNGAIVFLDNSLKSELGRVNLLNCGIFRLAPLKAEAGSENIQRTVAELYCERMDYMAKSPI